MQKLFQLSKNTGYVAEFNGKIKVPYNKCCSGQASLRPIRDLSRWWLKVSRLSRSWFLLAAEQNVSMMSFWRA
jgi:hypothetical protein